MEVHFARVSCLSTTSASSLVGTPNRLLRFAILSADNVLTQFRETPSALRPVFILTKS